MTDVNSAARAALADLMEDEPQFSFFYGTSEQGRIVLKEVPFGEDLATWWVVNGRGERVLFCYRKGASVTISDGDMVKTHEVRFDLGGVILHAKPGHTRLSQDRATISFARIATMPPGARIDDHYKWVETPLVTISPTTGMMNIALA